jgi:hypothetical protein
MPLGRVAPKLVDVLRVYCRHFGPRSDRRLAPLLSPGAAYSDGGDTAPDGVCLYFFSSTAICGLTCPV